MSKVAYIIVGWNNEDLLEECFLSIDNQTHNNKRVIYVDNDSGDKSVELVRKKFPDNEILQPGSNTGFARGNNLGIRTALKDPEVEFIVLLNTDARLAENWTEELLKFIGNKPKVALLQGLTLDYYDHNVIDSTHTYISQNGQATQGGWRFYNAMQFGPKKVFGVNAAACLITRKFIEAQPFKEQLFDEKMFMYLEDVDLAARATIMGWDNYLVSGTVAYHMGSASSGKNPGFSLYMTYRNNIAMLAKNIPHDMLLKMAYSIFIADRHTIRHLKRANQKGSIKSIRKGRIAGFIRLPIYIPSIVKMHQYRKQVSKDYLWKLMKRGY